MRKILFFLTIFIFLALGANASDDTFNTPSELNRNLDSQKIITPQQYEETLSKLKGQQKKKKNKHKELMPSSVLDEETLEQPTMFEEKYNATLMIPTMLVYQSGVIPVGFYKVCATKDDNNNYFLQFFQSDKHVATVKAFLTRNNYGEDNINYVKLLPYTDNSVRIIYGSIDFNLETLMKVF